jgi:hypothetical protein
MVGLFPTQSSAQPASPAAATAAAAAAADCPSPEEVVLDICRHVQASQSLPSRHLMRLLPVSHTCGISKDEITAMAAKVAEKHFPTGAAASSNWMFFRPA